jgi:hypothetical protein
MTALSDSAGRLWAIVRRHLADQSKVDASRAAAAKGGQERHDLSDSADAEEYYDVARRSE